MDDYYYEDNVDDTNYYYDIDVDDDDDSGDYGGVQYDYEDPTNIVNWSDVLESCIRPTIIQIINYIVPLITWNLIYRISTQILHVEKLLYLHLISSICGSFILCISLNIGYFYFIGFSIIYFLIYKSICYLKLRQNIDCIGSLKLGGHTIAILCIIVLIIGELLQNDLKLWHQIRGTQMIMIMKLISIGYDTDISEIKKTTPTSTITTTTTTTGSFKMKELNFIEYMGYLLFPGNVLLGPWITYNEYLQIYRKPSKWNVHWYLAIIGNLLISIIFLIASNCIFSLFITDNAFKITITYRDALSFRCSHYFITFLSQSLIITSGYTFTFNNQQHQNHQKPKHNENPKPQNPKPQNPKQQNPKHQRKQKHKKQKHVNDEMVVSLMSNKNIIDKNCGRENVSINLKYFLTKPWFIEWPRSLVQVVIVWNISMHNFLKTYIFRNAKKQYNSIFIAILSTYFVSALLHGLNLQLGLILLSLGIFTYVEYKLRDKLAKIFNACISAKSCNTNHACAHDYKRYNRYVILVNGFFSIITILNLAYLGVMFEASLSTQEEGYSFAHAIKHWRSLYFFSHWLTLFTYLCYLII